MNANFHGQSVTGVWMSYLFIARRVIGKSNDKSYRARSMSEITFKHISGEKKINVIYRPWSVRTFETLGKVFLDTDLPVGK